MLPLGVDQGGSCYSRRTSHNPVDLNMLCESSTVSSPISATRSNQNHAVLYMRIDSRCVQIQVLQQYIIRAYCTAQLRASESPKPQCMALRDNPTLWGPLAEISDIIEHVRIKYK